MFLGRLIHFSLHWVPGLFEEAFSETIVGNFFPLKKTILIKFLLTASLITPIAPSLLLSNSFTKNLLDFVALTNSVSLGVFKNDDKIGI